MTRSLIFVFMFILSSILTACGGGGGGGGSGGGGSSGPAPTPTSSSSSSSTSSSASSGASSSVSSLANGTNSLVWGKNLAVAGSTKVLPLTPVPSLVPPAATNDTAEVFARHQGLRQSAGLPATLYDSALSLAQQNHTSYLVNNHISGLDHGEVAGMPGFTGVVPFIRATNAGFVLESGSPLVEVLNGASSTSFATSVDDLWNTPYHGLPLMGNYKSCGAGATAQTPSTSSIIGITCGNLVASTGLAVSPYNGQTCVKKNWVANENPNPFPASSGKVGTTVGKVVNVTLGQPHVLTNVRLTLEDSSGVLVESMVLDKDTDVNGGLLNGGTSLIPLSPLASNTTYRWRLNATVAPAWLGATSINSTGTFTTCP